MANYYATARTNYFKVKDDNAFREFLSQFSGVRGIKEDEKWVILFDEEGIPSFIYDEEAYDDEEVDFPGEVAAFLADGEVAVFEEVGAEKLRYVNGFAIAINNKGESVSLSLDNIYGMAKQAGLGENISTATY